MLNQLLQVQIIFKFNNYLKKIYRPRFHEVTVVRKIVMQSECNFFHHRHLVKTATIYIYIYLEGERERERERGNYYIAIVNMRSID